MVWFVTDPVRTPDPANVAERLPPGTGVIYRHFGHPGALVMAERLAQIARRRGLMLLIGLDAALATHVGAAGVHLPERDIVLAQRLRARHPHWILTCAAHSRRALHRAQIAGVDAALVSAIFPSLSPSAGAPLGPVRLAGLVREASLPIYALGGVNAQTARRLIGAGVSGFAAVEALASTDAVQPRI